MRVNDLTPGDIVILDGPFDAGGVCFGTMPHPLFPGLTMVLWRLRDGSYSYDALSPMQEVGEAQVLGPEQRRDALRWAIGLHGSSSPFPSTPLDGNE